MPELSFESMMNLYKLSSIGRLTGGLIHNLNGPLQNIGLDIEMARYMLKGDSASNELKKEQLQNRLERIEGELDRLSRMINMVSSKTIFVEKESFNSSLNDYFEQELVYLSANLYLKHNIKINLDLTNNPPSPRHLPENSLCALSWLLQILADDMEKNSVTQFTLKTELDTEALRITFSTQDGGFSEDLTKLLNEKTSPCDGGDVGIMLILSIFKNGDVNIKTGNGNSRSGITVEIPIQASV